MKPLLTLILFLPFWCAAQTDPEQILFMKEQEAKWKKEHPGKAYNEENVRGVVDTIAQNAVAKDVVKKMSVNNRIKDSSTIDKYCMVLATQRFLSTKVTITVDYGDQSGWFADIRMRNETGKVAVFNNVVDALNYMGALGWKLTTTLLLGSGPYVYHFLFKKEFIREHEPTASMGSN